MSSLTAVTGETSSSPTLKHLLLAENEFAFLINRSDLLSKHILHVRKQQPTLEGLLLILFGCLPEVKLGPQKCVCTVTRVYDVAAETVYIVKLYTAQHTGARCESLNKHRSCGSYWLMKSLLSIK